MNCRMHLFDLDNRRRGLYRIPPSSLHLHSVGSHIDKFRFYCGPGGTVVGGILEFRPLRGADRNGVGFSVVDAFITGGVNGDVDTAKGDDLEGNIGAADFIEQSNVAILRLGEGGIRIGIVGPIDLVGIGQFHGVVRVVVDHQDEDFAIPAAGTAAGRGKKNDVLPINLLGVFDGRQLAGAPSGRAFHRENLRTGGPSGSVPGVVHIMNRYTPCGPAVPEEMPDGGLIDLNQTALAGGIAAYYRAAGPAGSVIPGIDKAGVFVGVGVGGQNHHAVQRPAFHAQTAARTYAVESVLSGTYLMVVHDGCGPGPAAVAGFDNPQVRDIADMETGVVEEHILLDPFRGTQPLAVDFILRRVSKIALLHVQIVVLIHIEAGLFAAASIPLIYGGVAV